MSLGDGGLTSGIGTGTVGGDGCFDKTTTTLTVAANSSRMRTSPSSLNPCNKMHSSRSFEANLDYAGEVEGMLERQVTHHTPGTSLNNLK